MSNELTDLREKLNRYFSLGELKTICFDLGIDHESLDTGNKPALVESLIVHLGRTGRMPELLALVRGQRQHVVWPDVSQVELQTAVAAASKATIVNKFSGPATVHQGQGNIIMGNIGDTFNMSGDFRGAILNIKSTLNNVSQTVGSLPAASSSDKEALQKLIDDLNKALVEAPADKAEDAAAVAEAAKMHVETAQANKPNKTMVKITGEGLKQAAENIKAVLPTVLTIATQIVATISRIVGMGG